MISIFEKNMKFPLLLDVYGALLSDRRREIVEYYYNDDCSLAEISEITGISRQGVRDSIKKTEEEIYSLEEKLGVARKMRLISEKLDSIASLAESSDKRDGILAGIDGIRAIIRTDEEEKPDAHT